MTLLKIDEYVNLCLIFQSRFRLQQCTIIVLFGISYFLASKEATDILIYPAANAAVYLNIIIIIIIITTTTRWRASHRQTAVSIAWHQGCICQIFTGGGSEFRLATSDYSGHGGCQIGTVE